MSWQSLHAYAKTLHRSAFSRMLMSLTCLYSVSCSQNVFAFARRCYRATVRRDPKERGFTLHKSLCQILAVHIFSNWQQQHFSNNLEIRYFLLRVFFPTSVRRVNEFPKHIVAFCFIMCAAAWMYLILIAEKCLNLTSLRHQTPQINLGICFCCWSRSCLNSTTEGKTLF